jgi:hypothetical protein
MRLSSVAVIGALALAGPALGAAGAASAATRLVLSENGSPVVAGEAALDYHLIFDGGCLQASRGQVLSNDRPTDKLVFAVAPEESECLEEGFSVTGSLTQVLLSHTGAATLQFKPKLAITEPGPCVYEFARLGGTFPATVEVEIEGAGTGKLRRKLSASGCPSTRTVEFKGVESGLDNDIFGAELAA